MSSHYPLQYIEKAYELYVKYEKPKAVLALLKEHFPEYEIERTTLHRWINKGTERQVSFKTRMEHNSKIEKDVLEKGPDEITKHQVPTIQATVKTLIEKVPTANYKNGLEIAKAASELLDIKDRIQKDQSLEQENRGLKAQIQAYYDVIPGFEELYKEHEHEIELATKEILTNNE